MLNGVSSWFVRASLFKRAVVLVGTPALVAAVAYLRFREKTPPPPPPEPPNPVVYPDPPPRVHVRAPIKKIEYKVAGELSTEVELFLKNIQFRDVLQKIGVTFSPDLYGQVVQGVSGGMLVGYQARYPDRQESHLRQTLGNLNTVLEAFLVNPQSIPDCPYQKNTPGWAIYTRLQRRLEETREIFIKQGIPKLLNQQLGKLPKLANAYLDNAVTGMVNKQFIRACPGMITQHIFDGMIPGLHKLAGKACNQLVGTFLSPTPRSVRIEGIRGIVKDVIAAVPGHLKQFKQTNGSTSRMKVDFQLENGVHPFVIDLNVEDDLKKKISTHLQDKMRSLKFVHRPGEIAESYLKTLEIGESSKQALAKHLQKKINDYLHFNVIVHPHPAIRAHHSLKETMTAHLKKQVAKVLLWVLPKKGTEVLDAVLPSREIEVILLQLMRNAAKEGELAVWLKPLKDLGFKKACSTFLDPKTKDLEPVVHGLVDDLLNQQIPVIADCILQFTSPDFVNEQLSAVFVGIWAQNVKHLSSESDLGKLKLQHENSKEAPQETLRLEGEMFKLLTKECKTRHAAAEKMMHLALKTVVPKQFLASVEKVASALQNVAENQFLVLSIVLKRLDKMVSQVTKTPSKAIQEALKQEGVQLGRSTFSSGIDQEEIDKWINDLFKVAGAAIDNAHGGIRALYKVAMGLTTGYDFVMRSVGAKKWTSSALIWSQIEQQLAEVHWHRGEIFARMVLPMIDKVKLAPMIMNAMELSDG